MQLFLSDPDDYDGVSGTLSFTSDATESCVTINVEDDSTRESVPECFTVALLDVTGADFEEPRIATVCIEDNDGEILGHYRTLVDFVAFI